VIGPGESVNVVDPSLEVEGTLTDTDRAYLEAMKAVGLRKVMLSYAERPEDVEEVKALLPGSEVVLKIESRRGLALAREHGAGLGRLMAARGDLYVEVLEPHRIVGALREVIRADPEAIAGSRLFPSLARHPVPEAQDVTDAAFLMALGYRTFLLGDEICLRRDSVLEALNLLAAVAGEM
jgi:pyruvate kinase